MDINIALKQLNKEDNNYRLSSNAPDSNATIVYWDSNNSDTQPTTTELTNAWNAYTAANTNYSTDVLDPPISTTMMTTGGTFSANVTFQKEITENTYECTGTVLDPVNGTVQYKTLGANTTFTEGLAAGQSMLIQITAGSYTATFPTITWVGGSAPTLSTSKPTAIELWKIGTTLYGANVGDLG